MEKRYSRDERTLEQGGGDCSSESEEGTSSESDNELPCFKNSSSNLLFREKDVPLQKPHRQLCRSPCLDQPSFSQSSLLQDLKLEDGKANPDKEYQAKIDFALKLGYAGDQIQAVLSKLGADALINDILAELVRLGNKAENEGPASLGSATAPLGGTAAKEVTSPELSLEEEVVDSSDNLRPIVIDGSNVAMSHGNKEGFSCRGIQLAERTESTRRSHYRFMPPDDPLGRHGPSLENFLRKKPVIPEHKKQPCPYGKKCTYGHKCKYYHPERTNQPLRSVADELRISAKLSAVKTMSEGALAKCGSGPALCKGGENPSEVKRNPPKRQSDPSIRSVAMEPEDRLSMMRKPEASSVPSLVTALSVPTLPPPKSHAVGALNARSASSPVPGSSSQFAHQKSSLEHMASMHYPPILVTNSHGAAMNYADP
ncbi:putative ribonuclease ZC3H12B [Crotalus adamanteus]|uniref:Ribonuclease ZC3H12B n=1 Tax=Crotalus adamanteus TaxID=8729 RepID=A0AAW1AVV2_CROAD